MDLTARHDKFTRWIKFAATTRHASSGMGSLRVDVAGQCAARGWCNQKGR